MIYDNKTMYCDVYCTLPQTRIIARVQLKLSLQEISNVRSTLDIFLYYAAIHVQVLQVVILKVDTIKCS